MRFGHYELDRHSGRFVAHAIHVLTFEGDRIAAIMAFRSPQAFAGFGLPEQLPAGA